MISKVEAVVLRSIEYGESSKIVNLYTREFGALGVMVKGARRSHRKFGSALEPLSHISAVVYKKETRTLQLLTQAELIDDFSPIQKEFDSLFLSLSILELTNQVTYHQERNEDLFELLLDHLCGMRAATYSAIRLFYHFEVCLIDILGFKPSILACSDCGTPIYEIERRGDDTVFFDSHRGVFQCRHCLPHLPDRDGTRVQALRLWEQFARSSVKEIIGYPIALDTRHQIEFDRLISEYMKLHIPEIKGNRSKRIFDSLRT